MGLGTVSALTISSLVWLSVAKTSPDQPILSTAFTDNPLFEPIYNGQPVQEIVDGPYQVEVRTSRELLNETTNQKWLAAYVGINERLAQGSI